MRFALCPTLREATTAQLESPEYCAQFMGALWIPKFIERMKALGHEVVAGREALQDRPGEAIVIQEDRELIGRQLIKRGASSGVLFCLESPLYSPTYYDHRELLRKKFNNRVWDFLTPDTISFPSLSEAGPFHNFPWALRKSFVVAIFSPKHHSLQHPKLHKSPAWRQARKTQLQDQRFAVVHALKTLGIIDLYGRGWQYPDGHPVDDKILTLSRYKFAICFENIRMAGYCTEKLIHCFQAGVIPIYLGDPELPKRIPKELYIDFSAYKNWDAFFEAIKHYPESNAEQMIQNAHNWLKSPSAREWTYEGFADEMVKRCLHSI